MRTHAGNFTTLPQYFREHGYRSGGAVVTWLEGKTTSPITGHYYNECMMIPSLTTARPR